MYTAKYLPVEGEIKEGELVINIEAAPHSPFQWCGENPQYFKKVKLFLTSTDIQVGDKDIRWPDGSGAEKHRTCINEADADWWKSVKGFKVIGEISKDAVWVKEGDVFSKEQCQFPTEYWPATASNDGAHTVKYPFTESDEQPYEHIQLPVQILGPCGHFH